MVYCKDCKYWQLSGSYWDGRRICGQASWGFNELFTVDGGDNSDSLYTAPNFGCVVGIKKENLEEIVCKCGHSKSDHAMEYGKGGALCRHISKNNFYCSCEDYKPEKEE